MISRFPNNVDILQLAGEAYSSTIVDANSVNIMIEAIYELQTKTISGIKTDYHATMSSTVPDQREFSLNRSEYKTDKFPITDNPMKGLMGSNSAASTDLTYYNSAVDIELPVNVCWKHSNTGTAYETVLETHLDNDDTAVFLFGLAEHVDVYNWPHNWKTFVHGHPVWLSYGMDPSAGRITGSMRARFVVPDTTIRLHAKVLIVTNAKVKT